MNKLSVVSCLLFCLFFLLNCKQDTSGGWTINPNGDSELALLMREMYDECLMVGEQIESGKIKKIKAGLDGILSAEATQPEKVNTVEYKAFAESYLQTVKAFNESKKSKLDQDYTMILNSCITCHESLCPGPVKKIEKLFLD